jgi:hypothetical protein
MRKSIVVVKPSHHAFAEKRLTVAVFAVKKKLREDYAGKQVMTEDSLIATHLPDRRVEIARAARVGRGS